MNGTCNEEEVGEVHARTRRRTQTERADRESAAAATLPLYLAFCETLFMSRAYSWVACLVSEGVCGLQPCTLLNWSNDIIYYIP